MTIAAIAGIFPGMSHVLTILLATVCQHPALGTIWIGNAGGTCTLVATGECDVWLTAYHVVQGQPNRVTIRHKSGTYRGRVFVTNPKLDAALVSTNQMSGCRQVAIWRGKTSDAQVHWAEGWDYRNRFLRLRQTYRRPRSDVMVYYAGRQPISGQSGGAVLTESEGRHWLTGLITGAYGQERDQYGRITDTTVGCWGCRITPLRDFLSSVRWRVGNVLCCLTQRGPYMVCEPYQGEVAPDTVQHEPPEAIQYEPEATEYEPEPTSSTEAIDYERLATLVAEKLPEPERGPAGPQGDAGPRGPEGPPGKNASLDVESIVSAVLEQLPRYSLEFVDSAGNVIGEPQRPEFGGAFQIPVR